MPFPQNTAQQHNVCGLLLGKLDCTKRVFLTHHFTSDVAKSSSYKGTSKTNVVASWDDAFVRSGDGTMLAAAHSGGGVKLTASSAQSANGALLKPRINTAWTDWKWDTAKEPAFECLFSTGANVTTIAIHAGLMLTGACNSTTDANQAKLFYDTAAGAAAVNFKVQLSATGTDTSIDTGVTAVANTTYHFALAVTSDLYVNWALTNAAGTAYGSGKSTTALTTAINLIPMIGVASDAAAAHPYIFPHRITCSMNAYVS